MQSPIDFNMTLTNEHDIMQSLQGIVPQLSEEAALALWGDLDDLMSIIKSDHVPIDTGELRDSGYVNPPVETGAGYEIEVGFTAEHALEQHERLDYHHRHGQAKYLEQPLMEYLDIKMRR